MGSYLTYKQDDDIVCFARKSGSYRSAPRRRSETLRSGFFVDVMGFSLLAPFFYLKYNRGSPQGAVSHESAKGYRHSKVVQ